MNEEMIRQFGTEFQKIETEIGSVIIGQKDLIRGVLTAMIAGGNVLLEGLPGLGKTQLVKTIGKVLDLDFSRIQFTPDLMPADVTGTSVMTKNQQGEMGMEFRRGPVFSNIVLADEINRATPKTQSALLEAMQEHTVTSGNETYLLPEPFFVLATQNPLESEGTYPLPEAQMDRFLFKLDVSFPTKAELLEIVHSTTTGSQRDAKKVCGQEKLLEMRAVAREVPVATPVAEYIMDIVLKSHPEYDQAPEMVKKYVSFGASPRGAQAIMMTARVYALMAGRYNVAYEDVKAVAKGALRHRIFLNFEGMADGIAVDEIIEAILL
ncbi:ATPase family associated with various cellular activities (AAA) [Anaerotignum neopropionicum]|uniref:ATPase family associated with various cellular activities (AAA) n=1 Tax=Anaerotignum neopropionicum TaxID=36847 RepID=A0A136WBT8_9FIRM|nr:MoxR family ATPase [Anaerotignum neopropionicum]KXL51984.1 ATPase family associated with various cellular activities (AAA) [Anaerotignum neopropionicum]